VGNKGFLKDLLVGFDIDKSKICNDEAIIVGNITIWPSYDARRMVIRFAGANNYVEVSREYLADVASEHVGLIKLQDKIVELLSAKESKNYLITNKDVRVI